MVLTTTLILATAFSVHHRHFSAPHQLTGCTTAMCSHSSTPLAAVAHPRTGAIALLAKKKGGGGKKGKKGGKKESGFAWAANFELKPAESSALRELAELACNSYRSRTGKGLHRALDQGDDLPKALWKAPVAVMIVRAAAEGAGSVVTYANLAASEAHGLTASDGYKALIETPTPLAASLSDGKYESGYSKKLPLRAAADGADGADAGSFQLVDADRWSLEKMAVVDGKLTAEPIGLCYAFFEWQLEDGTTCRPGGVREAPSLDLAEIQVQVDAQGLEVRRLKEEEGLTNGDDAVKAAVAELLRLKALLEEVQE